MADNVRIRVVVDDEELKKLRKELDAVKKKLGDTGQGFDEIAEGAEKAQKETSKFGKGLGDLKKLAGTLGVAIALEEIARGFINMTKEAAKARKELVLLTGQVGSAADKSTAKLLATSKTFDKDFNEVLRAANTISKEFGISLNEAIDTINDGLSRGIDINGEYVDSMREYATFVSQAGFSTEEFNKLLEAQTKAGIFSDKGIDAVKEAVISLREFTPATRDALRAIGFNTDELLRGLRDGSISYADAVVQISDRLQEVGIESREAGQVLADVFRGAGEDAGRYVTTIGDTIRGTSELTEEQQKLYDQTQELLGAQEAFSEELVIFGNTWRAATRGLAATFTSIGAEALKAINILQGVATSENLTFWQKLKTLIGTVSPAGQAAAAAVVAVDRAQKDAAESANALNDQEEKLVKETRKAKPALDAQAKSTKKKGEETKITTQSILDFIKAEDALTEAIFREMDADEQLRSELAEVEQTRQKNIREQELQELQAHEDKKREIKEGAINASIELSGILFDFQNQQLNNQIAALEFQAQREIELAGDNEAAKIAIEERSQKKIAELRAKQARNEKAQAIFSTIINTARAVVGALPNIPLSVIIGSLGAAQTAAIAARPIPRFARGTKKVPGLITGQDSVLSALMPGEGVMPVDRMAAYRPTYDAIFDKKIDPGLINSFVNQATGKEVITNNREVIKDRTNIHIDERGYIVNVQKNLNSLTKQVHKYSMRG